MGEHGLWQKMSLFEGSSRVPMLIVAPGTSGRGTIVESPVSQIDLFPTLAELCGITAPDNLQGQSLVPMLNNSSVTGRGWALTQVTRRNPTGVEVFYGYSLRTRRWRYTEWDGGEQGQELYDHETDPRELNNLANDPAKVLVVAELSKQMHIASESTFPASGQRPTLRDGTWKPNLTDP